MPAHLGVAACSVHTAIAGSRISSAISLCFPCRSSLCRTLSTHSLPCIPCSQHSFQCLWCTWHRWCPQHLVSAARLQGAGTWCLKVSYLQWPSSHLGSMLPGCSAVRCFPYSQHAQDEAQQVPLLVPVVCWGFEAHGVLKAPSSVVCLMLACAPQQAVPALLSVLVAHAGAD